MKKNALWVILAIGLLAIALAACQANDEPALEIENAWGRPAPSMAMMGAFYMTISNEGASADYLLGAETDACGVVEMHETFMSEDNVMSMRPVEGGKIEIPAKGQAVLEPGGMHLMCINKMDAFTVGATIPVTLNFENAGETTVEFEIREP